MSQSPLPIAWLEPGDDFPPTHQALEEPNGLLAVGGDLGINTLLNAYRQGIFPWFNQNDPLLWWTPDPRMVIFPDEFHCSRRLQRTLRAGKFVFSINQCFDRVVQACAAPRSDATGTWITDSMYQAYRQLHRAGQAHSVEVWHHGELAGGVYGVKIGRVFYGESMFSAHRDASKAALALLCALKDREDNHQLELLDCQLPSNHLFTLGGRLISRSHFEQLLTRMTTGEDHFSAHPIAPLEEYTSRYRLESS